MEEMAVVALPLLCCRNKEGSEVGVFVPHYPIAVISLVTWVMGQAPEGWSVPGAQKALIVVVVDRSSVMKKITSKTHARVLIFDKSMVK